MQQIDFIQDGARHRARHVLELTDGQSQTLLLKLPDSDKTSLYIHAQGAAPGTVAVNVYATLSPREVVARYAAGEPVDISLIPLAELTDATPFSDAINSPVSALFIEASAIGQTTILIEALQ